MIAPQVLDGPMNGDAFIAYVTACWCLNSHLATSSSWTTCPAIIRTYPSCRLRLFVPLAVLVLPRGL